MAQDESPLIAGARKLYRGFEKYVGDPSKPAGKQKDTTDYSWHAKKVAEANQSHADAMSKKGVGQKTAVAKSKAKRGQRKAARKRGGK